MVELIGDICMPSELVVPTQQSNASAISGTLVYSGAKLFVKVDGVDNWEAITSAA